MSAPSQRGSIVDDGVHGDGMVRRHAGQAAIAMLLHATCSHREVEPRFIRVWLQGPVLQDAAAANRRSCVRNVLTDVAQQEDQDGNHAHADRLLQEALRELTHVTNGSPLTASSVCVCRFHVVERLYIALYNGRRFVPRRM